MMTGSATWNENIRGMVSLSRTRRTFARVCAERWFASATCATRWQQCSGPGQSIAANQLTVLVRFRSLMPWVGGVRRTYSSARSPVACGCVGRGLIRRSTARRGRRCVGPRRRARPAGVARTNLDWRPAEPGRPDRAQMQVEPEKQAPPYAAARAVPACAQRQVHRLLGHTLCRSQLRTGYCRSVATISPTMST